MSQLDHLYARKTDPRHILAKGNVTLKNALIIDGTGAPPFGPTDIVIKDGIIIDLIAPENDERNIHATFEKPVVHLSTDGPVIDLEGAYVMPGFIDAHAHFAEPDQIDTNNYFFDLWVAHGITTVREAGCIYHGFDFIQHETERSDSFEITAPKIYPYVTFGQGLPAPISDEETARSWVRELAQSEAYGIKFFGTPPNVMEAALKEAQAVGLRTMCHHASTHPLTTALKTSTWGLNSIEHMYGIADSMLENHSLLQFPSEYSYNDEVKRFWSLGRVWEDAVEPGTPEWNAAIHEFADTGVTMVPTFVAYLAARDVDHAMGRSYHQDFTTYKVAKFFRPGGDKHGTFFDDWGTEEEVAWRQSYTKWMKFIFDFHSAGGNVAIGSDAAYIYNLFGFGFVEEMEIMREVGFLPAEIIRMATLNGAKLLGIDDTTGTIEVGKDADLVVVEENPLSNLKSLYAHGHRTFGHEAEESRVGGPTLTVKKGYVYDAKKIIQNVKEYVKDERDGRSSDLFNATHVPGSWWINNGYNNE